MSTDYSSYKNQPSTASYIGKVEKNKTDASGKPQISEKQQGSLKQGESTEKSVTLENYKEVALATTSEKWMKMLNMDEQELDDKLFYTPIAKEQFNREVETLANELRHHDKTSALANSGRMDFVSPKVTQQNDTTTNNAPTEKPNTSTLETTVKTKRKHTHRPRNKTISDTKVSDVVVSKLNQAPKTAPTTPKTTGNSPPTEERKTASEPSTPTFANQPLKEIMHIAQEHIPKDLKEGEIRKLDGKLHDVYVIKLGGQHAFVKEGDKLGKGAFNTAYTVSDIAGAAVKEYGELVLKMSHRAQSSEEIKQEIETTRLNLPHVVFTVAYHTFEKNGESHVIMLQPALKGGDFEKLKQNETPIGVKIEALRQFAEGECELQDNGIFQKDIKPANVMLQEPVGPHSENKDVKVKVIDFGTNIKMEDYEDKKNTLAYRGTPTYAAPEALVLNFYKTPKTYFEEKYKPALENYNEALAGYERRATENRLTDRDKRLGPPKMPQDPANVTNTLQNVNNAGTEMAKQMLYTDGKIDDNKIADFHKASEVYSYSVAAFETLFGELPENAKQVEGLMKQKASKDSAFNDAANITRDTAYTEAVKKNQIDEAKAKGIPDDLIAKAETTGIPIDLIVKANEKGIPDDLMELVWRGMGDPSLRPSMSQFANYGQSPTV